MLDEALANWSALLYYKEVHGEERAAAALDDQLRGVYKVYRTFGGEDMAADRPAREYRNFFQYAAIVASKGALMFVSLRRLMGDEKFFAALRSYYETNMYEIAELDDLRGAFVAEAPLRAATRRDAHLQPLALRASAATRTSRRPTRAWPPRSASTRTSRRTTATPSRASADSSGSR